MTQEAKVACFVSKLNPPMDTRLQSLRLSTFAKVLDAGRSVEQEVGKFAHKEFKPQPPRDPISCEGVAQKREPDTLPQRSQDSC